MAAKTQKKQKLNPEKEALLLIKQLQREIYSGFSESKIKTIDKISSETSDIHRKTLVATAD